MHFYEASVITTKDGLHCQVYGNEHPIKTILVKPKYVPTNKVESSFLQYRFISGKKMNRLNLWTEKKELTRYLKGFKKAYPHYIFQSDMHKDKKRLFFGVPINKIERIYFPRRGFSELMSIPKDQLDEHLKLVHEFGSLLIQSGLKLNDLGITYSTLTGHYYSTVSDINIVVYGKANFWELIQYLKRAKHTLLSWKTKERWLDYYQQRNRAKIFNKKEFLRLMLRRKSEGYFGGSLFVIFGVENEDETWFKWGQEQYSTCGLATVNATVVNDFSSVVRPGMYEIKNSRIKEGFDNVPVKKIVFYSRDYSMLIRKGEKIKACGILEHVHSKIEEDYYRLVVGYFDAYITQRREKEYIKAD